MTLTQLKQELRLAEEGLEQMHQPEAGYYEDFNNKQYHEIQKFEKDLKAQVEGIDKLEKKILNYKPTKV